MSDRASVNEKKSKVAATEELSNEQFWDDGAFTGETCMYVATPAKVMWKQTSYEVPTLRSYEDLDEFRRNQVRAYREARKAGGKQPRELGRYQLQRELFVIPGPEMSAAEVVESLQLVIKSIRREGLVIGRDIKDEYIAEMLSGERKPLG
jgi:hypothetical protein